MKTYNDIKLLGRLYDFKVSEAKKKDGSPVVNDEGEGALTGRLTLEINDKGNTVQVEYFAYPKWPSGKVNSTFNILKGLMNDEYNCVASAEDDQEISWFSLVGSIEVNYFVAKQTKELARSLKIRGSFINDNKKKEYGTTWTADTIITNIEYVDADPEKDISAFARVDGYISDYKQSISEVSFQIHSEELIGKLSPELISLPFYTMLRGEIVFKSRTVTSTDAFGDEVENEYENRVWEVQKCALDNYDFYDEEILGEILFGVKVKELMDKKQSMLDNGGTTAEKRPELSF